MVEFTPQELAGLSEHDRAMVAKVDQSHAAAAASAGLSVPKPDASPTVPAKPERPADVPEKFWDADKGVVRTEALLKSYTDLERAKTAPAPAPAAKPAAAPAAAPVDGEATPAAAGEVAAAAEAAAKAAGADTSKVDFNAITGEFAEKGELSPETYATLEAAGMSKDLVDQFIEGRQAVQANQLNEAFGMVGGQEQYGQMLDWALKNMPAAEQAAFDRAVIADPATRKQAITALKAQYTAAMGADPSLVHGGSSEATAGAYQSRAEVTRDMNDARYRKDPAFRAAVERKLAASSVF